MHLAAILAVTLVCIVGILVLAFNGKPIPDAINYLAVGGGSYLLGNVVGAKPPSSTP